MKRTLVIILLVTGLGFSGNSFVWHKIGQGINESRIDRLTVHPKDALSIYAGTSQAVYHSADGGKNYRLVLRLSGEPKGVNDIYIPPENPESVYVATNNGLYESLDGGRNWEKIYSVSEEDARECFAVIQFGDWIYLGTGKGLFYKKAWEARWVQIKEGLGNEAVRHIVEDENFLYASTDKKVLRLEKETRQMTNSFSFGITKEDEETSGNSHSSLLLNVAISDLRLLHVVVASTRGISVGYSDGSHQEFLSTENLPLEDLTSLIVFEGGHAASEGCLESAGSCLRLMAGTRKGAFLFDEGTWIPVYKGMETNSVNSLTQVVGGDVYAATDRGIFYLSFREALAFLDEAKTRQSIMVSEDRPEHWPTFELEPNIHEVHQMAIGYAEVDPDKIKNWRILAKRKAWLPDLDVGVDQSRDWSSSDSIWGSYSNGGQHYVGPDDKTWGEDMGWDVSLSWDLSDLIWSTDQTTIDSRSKMMVELREDILNEVTRLYFERRRLQLDLALDSMSDWRLNADGEMRIAELTALIDALTGGKFSRCIEENSTNSHGVQKRRGR